MPSKVTRKFQKEDINQVEHNKTYIKYGSKTYIKYGTNPILHRSNSNSPLVGLK